MLNSSSAEVTVLASAKTLRSMYRFSSIPVSNPWCVTLSEGKFSANFMHSAKETRMTVSTECSSLRVKTSMDSDLILSGLKNRMQSPAVV